MIARAAKIWPNAAILVELLMRDRPHPKQGYRAAMGILSLSPRYGQERTEAACERALTINAITHASVTADLPLNFHPAAIRASAVLNRPRFLDQRRLEFSGFIQGGGLVAPPEFISEIGTLLPIAP